MVDKEDDDDDDDDDPDESFIENPNNKESSMCSLGTLISIVSWIDLRLAARARFIEYSAFTLVILGENALQ